MATIFVLILVALSALQETLEWKRETNYIDEFKENLSFIFPVLVYTILLDITLLYIFII